VSLKLESPRPSARTEGAAIGGQQPADDRAGLRSLSGGLDLSDSSRTGYTVSSEPTSSQTTAKVKLPIKQIAMLTRQMAMLLTSGSGVVPALQSIARQLTKPLHQEMIQRICLDLEEGVPLASALQRYPRTFDSTYCAIIAAGEASATLPEMFGRLAAIVGKRRVIRNRVLGAMAYPALLMTLSSGIISTLLFFVLPRFGGMFETLDVPLPASTSFLLALSDGLQTYWYLLIVVLAGLVAGVVYLFRTPGGLRLLGDVTLRTPMLGRLYAGMIQGEVFRVLGMLVEARVGILDALDLVHGISSNRRFKDLFDDMRDEVTSGGTVSDALDRSGLISPSVVQAIRTGEQSGQLGPSASYVADVLDDDNSELIETLTKLVEPAILIVMGMVVGSVSVSLFMPMFDMTAAI